MLTSNVMTTAEGVVTILRAANAVRIPENETEHGEYVGNFVTKEEICHQLDLYIGDWAKVRNYMEENGYPIVYKPGKGFYLGGKGESAIMDFHRLRMARGWERVGQRTRKKLSDMSEDSARWLKDTYGSSDLEYLDSDKVKRIARKGLKAPKSGGRNGKTQS